jgi:hypothetical protein
MLNTNFDLEKTLEKYLKYLQFGRVPFLKYTPQGPLLAKALPTAFGMYFSTDRGSLSNGLLKQCESSGAVDKVINSLILTAANKLGSHSRVSVGANLKQDLQRYYYDGMKWYYTLVKAGDTHSLLIASFLITYLHSLHYPDEKNQQGFLGEFLKKYHEGDQVEISTLFLPKNNSDVFFLENLLPLLPKELFSGQTLESEYSYTSPGGVMGIKRSDLRIDTKLFELKAYSYYTPKNLNVWRQLLFYGALGALEGRKPGSLWVYYPLDGIVEVLIPEQVMANVDFFFASVAKDLVYG